MFFLFRQSTCVPVLTSKAKGSWHWHILIWTACCNTCWLKACVANWNWRIWEWLLMGYNADHTHLSSNMSHDLHSLLWISVGRCCWSDFVYLKVTQYINPSKTSFLMHLSKIFLLLIFSLVVSYGRRSASRPWSSKIIYSKTPGDILL